MEEVDCVGHEILASAIERVDMSGLLIKRQFALRQTMAIQTRFKCPRPDLSPGSALAEGWAVNF